MTWQLSQNGTVLSTQTTDSFVFGAISGTYTLTLTVTDAQGDTATASTSVIGGSRRRVGCDYVESIQYGGQLDRDLRHAGLRRHRRRGQPAQLRHRHALGRVDLHLGREHDRSRGPSRIRRHRRHRRLLVLGHQLHGGREPDRRPDARPGAVLPRLGQQRPERAGADQQRRDGGGAGYRDDLVVHLGRLPGVGGQREHRDHDHEAGRAQRRAQRPVLRPGFDSDVRRPRSSSRTRRRRGTGSGPTARRATTSSATRPACPATPPSRPRRSRPTPGPPARPTRGPSRIPAAPAASPPPGTRRPASRWTWT